MKLDIGAGRGRRDKDFKTVDIEGEPDIKADMWAIPVEDNSVEEIYSAHALEHAPMAKVPEVLREWLRILKPDGRLELIVPNFDYVAKYWLTGPDRQWAEKMVFGLQTSDGEYHKSAFTPMLLRADLEGTGFIVRRTEVFWGWSQESIKAVARKPRPEEIAAKESSKTETPNG